MRRRWYCEIVEPKSVTCFFVDATRFEEGVSFPYALPGLVRITDMYLNLHSAES